MIKKPPKPESKSDKDYAQLGRMLENIYTSGYINKNEAYKYSFFKGVMGGLGGVIGATIIVALLVWILSLFQQVPLIGPFVDKVERAVNAQN